jgi:Cu2+-containing amine oxidase
MFSILTDSNRCLLLSDDDVDNGNPLPYLLVPRRESPADAVQEWVKDEGSLDNEDLLLFLTFG